MKQVQKVRYLKKICKKKYFGKVVQPFIHNPLHLYISQGD